MRLLPLAMEDVQTIVNKMEAEAKAIRSELFRMTWYMRGGLSITEAYMLDFHDREIISSIITENLETTKESKLPFF